MWGRFRRKEPDIGALQKALGRFRRSTRATKREDVVVLYGNAVRLGVGGLLILVTISLAFGLLRRRRREEAAPAPPLEAEEEALRLGDGMLVPPGPPSGEGIAPSEDSPLGEERPGAQEGL
jgi:hypothetical protein